MNEDFSSSESQVLLPNSSAAARAGYGILNINTAFADANVKEQSSSSVAAIISSRRQRVWAEAGCSLVACLGSLMIGLIVGFSSPTLTQLDHPEHLNQRIEAGSIYASIFGVSTGNKPKLFLVNSNNYGNTLSASSPIDQGRG